MNDNSNKLEKLIHAFSEEKNIPIVGASNLENLNQCAFAKTRSKSIYLVAHDDIDIIQRYFNLSDRTFQKITDFRKFSFSIYGSSSKTMHNRLKVILSDDNTIELSILGLGLSSLMIKLTDNDLIISLMGYYDEIKAPLLSFDDIDSTLSIYLDLFKLQIIEKLGFDSADIHLSDFTKFMNIPNEQLLDYHFNSLHFNYFSNTAFIKSLSSIFNYDVTKLKVNNDDYDDYDDKVSIEIPYHLSNVIPYLVKKVVPRKKDSYSMIHLINLMKFYYNLIGTPEEKNIFELFFIRLQKSELSPSSNFNRVYYSISLGDKLDIHIGYKLKHHNQFYTCVLDPEVPEDGTYYMFSSRIIKDDSLRPSQTFTDNIDYIYTNVLNQIRDYINDSINNIDNPLTERHLELFKMVMI